MKHIMGMFAEVQAPTSIPQVAISNALVLNIFNTVLGLAGALAVAFVVWGGMQFTLSKGDPNSIAKAKNTILYALIGVVVVLSSFVIVNYILGNF